MFDVWNRIILLTTSFPQNIQTFRNAQSSEWQMNRGQTRHAPIFVPVIESPSANGLESSKTTFSILSFRKPHEFHV
jgi:hypothetical protein